VKPTAHPAHPATGAREDAAGPATQTAGASVAVDAAPAARPAAAASTQRPLISGTVTSDPFDCYGGQRATPSPTAPVQTRDPERYVLLGEHGRGGLGRVSRAHDRELGRDIAIKELISRGHGNVAEVRFLREALITARLEHPGIVPVYEAGRWPDGTPFYAMKLVAGRPLRDLIAERTTVEQRIGLLHHVIAVADAIAYAHGRGIIHRDLKPSNVIVGEFGETIVIDWGLAKDLNPEPAPVGSDGGGPSGEPRQDGLTSAGSVMGTPAYMPPEQRRGEQVDPRADVYAIGAMLWELCALPREPRATGRRHALRRAGIDPDLATIIAKALEDAPDRRYADAGALAADLKAFKAGARIAARRYSLLAMLVHWTRRHRALAAATLSVAALAATGVLTYVRHIAAERDRVAAANSALILEHAQLLMHSDPTAAAALLASYRGGDTTRHAMLRAEARGLGVATLHAAPSAQRIDFLERLPDGSLLTLAPDGAVVRTAIDGTARTIALGTVEPRTWDYLPTRGWFAYSCATSGICLLDVVHERPVPLPEVTAAFSPTDLTFSPGGALFASISTPGELAIWRVPHDGAPSRVAQVRLGGGEQLVFVDDATLAATGRDGVQLIHLDAAGHVQGAPTELALPNLAQLTTTRAGHLIAATTTTGELVIIDAASAQLTARAEVCLGRVNQAVWLAGRTAIAYSCRDGVLGIWKLDGGVRSVVAHLDGGTSMITASADGRYLIAGGQSGRLIVHDTTSGISTSYLGDRYPITAVAPPTAAFPNVATGDLAGELWVWPLPSAAATVAIHTAARMSLAVPLPGGAVVALAGGDTLPWYRGPGQAGELPGHSSMHGKLAIAPHEPQLMVYGGNDELELWSLGPQPSRWQRRAIHGPVIAAEYEPDGRGIVLGHRDGAVVEVSPTGDEQRTIGEIGEPVVSLRAPGDAAGDGTIALDSVRGALWLIGPARPSRSLSYLDTVPDPIATIAISRDARWLGIASPRGVVRIYDLATRAVSVFESPHPSTVYLAFTPDSRQVVVATRRTLTLVPLSRVVPGVVPVPLPRGTIGSDELAPWQWRDIDIAPNELAFSLDGRWFAVMTDRGVWIQRAADARWAYVPTGDAAVRSGRFTPDRDQLIATDTDGRALVIELSAIAFE
jgi:WD40 repeat protein